MIQGEELNNYNLSKDIVGRELTKEEKRLCTMSMEVTVNYPCNTLLSWWAFSDSIKLRRPDAQIWDAFQDVTCHGMFYITLLDYEKYRGLVQPAPKEDSQKRFCHMSLIQNRQFADVVLRVLRKETDMSIQDHLFKDNIKKHFTSSPTLEESGLIKLHK